MIQWTSGAWEKLWKWDWHGPVIGTCSADWGLASVFWEVQRLRERKNKIHTTEKDLKREKYFEKRIKRSEIEKFQGCISKDFCSLRRILACVVCQTNALARLYNTSKWHTHTQTLTFCVFVWSVKHWITHTAEIYKIYMCCWRFVIHVLSGRLLFLFKSESEQISKDVLGNFTLLHKTCLRKKWTIAVQTERETAISSLFSIMKRSTFYSSEQRGHPDLLLLLLLSVLFKAAYPSGLRRGCCCLVVIKHEIHFDVHWPLSVNSLGLFCTYLLVIQTFFFSPLLRRSCFYFKYSDCTKPMLWNCRPTEM